MTNQLIKNLRATYTAGSPGVPADPGYPARAAYTSWNWQTVCKYREVTYTWTQDPDGVWRYVPLYSGALGPYECTRQLVPTYYPYDPGKAPTPGVPAGPYQVTYDFNLGWNAGAGSVRSFDRHGIARFTASPGVIGAVTGLARESARRGNYQDIEHGIYVSHGIARIYEKGVEVAYGGAVASGTELAVSRINNVVRYHIGASVVHVSALPSTGKVHLVSALYAGGDYIDAPSITNTMLFAGMEASGKENTTSETSPYTRGMTENLILTDSYAGTLPSTGSMSFLPMAGSGGVAGHSSGAVASFEEMTAEGSESQDLVPSYSIAAVSLVPMTCSGSGSSRFAVAKTSTTVERDYVTGVITVIVSGTPDTAVTVTFPSGETRTGTISENGILIISSSPSEPTTGSVVITTIAPNGTVQTQTITFNANGSITVSGTGAAPGASAGGQFQNGSTATTAAADGTYTMTSAINQPLGAFSAFLTVGGYMSFRPLEVSGGSPTGTSYAQGVMSFAPMTVYAHGLEGNTQASMQELSVAADSMSYIGFVDVALYSSVTGQTTMVTLAIRDAAMVSSVTGTPTMTYSAVLQALMDILVEVTSGIPVLSEAGEVWVVNAETEASSMYEDFSYNSFGKIGTKYYGAKEDGIYLLEGDDDAGAPIRASISFGEQDFGNTVEKRVPNAYIGVAASGNVYLRVIANGVTNTYVTNRSNSYARTQRLKLGRGIKATHFVFELYNEDGSDFELDTVEFEVIDLTRRI